MSTKAELRSELAELLARAVELKRLNLTLPPRERERLKSLLLALGLWKGAIPMNRRKVKRYAEVGGNYEDYSRFISGIGANPSDPVARLAFADFLQENGIPGAHIVRAHAQGMQDGRRSPDPHPRYVQPGYQSRERHDNDTMGSFGPNGRIDILTHPMMEQMDADGDTATRMQIYFYGPKSHKRGLILGVMHRTPEGTWITHSAHAATPGKFRELLSDFPPEQVSDLIAKHIGRTRNPAKVVDQAAAAQTERLSRRRLRFAKAEKTRHPAHDLIAGFPLEHALRHLANDPDNSPTLRQTAFVALTGQKDGKVSQEGHPEALWALNDLLQEHENKDGTTGHPLARAYNWMSAADKVLLDRHTRQALVEASNDAKVGVPHTHHNDWLYSPEHRAQRANMGMKPQPPGVADFDHEDNVALSHRIRSRVKELSPHSTDDDIKKSIQRHSIRALYIWRLEHSTGAKREESRALLQPDELEGPSANEEKAARYGRRYSVTVSEIAKGSRIEDRGSVRSLRSILDPSGPRRYSETTEDDFHRMLDANPDDHHTRLVFADWLQDRGDPRAEGYRALGQLGKTPRYVPGGRSDGQAYYVPHSSSSNWHESWRPHTLPDDWKTGMEIGPVSMSGAVYGSSRRELEDRAAIAFSKLPPDRQAEIVKPTQLSRRRYLKPRTDFIDALRRARSSQFTQLRQAAKAVAAKLGFHPVSTASALHDSPQGSVPGIAQALYGNASPETVHEAASWSGLTNNLPGVAVFHPRATGPDRLYRVRVHGSGLDLRQKLDRFGITNRVLIPHRQGFDLLVPDKGGVLGNAVSAFARQHNHELQVSPGFLHTFGSQDRSQARSQFRDKIVQSESVRKQRRVVRMARPDEVTHNALIRSIIENSREATPRLAFADFLQENGIPGAHIVRDHAERISQGGGTSPGHQRGRRASRIMILGTRRRYAGDNLNRYNELISGRECELPMAQMATGGGKVLLSIGHRAEPDTEATGHTTADSVAHGVEVRDLDHLRHLTSDWPPWAQAEAERLAAPQFQTQQMARRRLTCRS